MQMHKAVSAFTIQHYISHTLLINFSFGLENSQTQDQDLKCQDQNQDQDLKCQDQNQDQDQDCRISVSSGLEINTVISRTTRLVLISLMWALSP